ncbi:MAG: TIR domain-containing protein [Pyrinomonadaceae bacterium]
MAHDIFISYAKEDREVAMLVSRALKDAGYKTWIAPDSIPPGTGYAGAIASAIASAPVMVLIHSEHSNDSKHILNEVNLAFNTGRPTSLIPFRIANIEYNADLQYYLARTQWVEAWTPPIEANLQPLVDWVRQIYPLPGSGAEATPPTPPVKTRDDKPRPIPLTWLVAGTGALLLLTIVALSAYLMGGGATVNANSNSVANNNLASNNLANNNLASNNGTNGNIVNGNVANLNANVVLTPTPPTPLTPTPMRTPARTPTPPPTPTPVPTPTPPPVQTPTPDSSQHDARITGLIKQNFSKYPGLSRAYVESVRGGSVTLDGEVYSQRCKTTAEKLSYVSRQVVGVTNRIRVVFLPKPQFKQELVNCDLSQ